MPAEHRFLKFILPARAFAAVRAGTKEWLAECSCGGKSDIWDSGGVCYKAVGESKELKYCPACRRSTLHKIRKKTEAEKLEMP